MKSILLVKKLLGLVEMKSGLVNASPNGLSCKNDFLCTLVHVVITINMFTTKLNLPYQRWSALFLLLNLSNTVQDLLYIFFKFNKSKCHHNYILATELLGSVARSMVKIDQALSMKMKKCLEKWLEWLLWWPARFCFKFALYNTLYYYMRNFCNYLIGLEMCRYFSLIWNTHKPFAGSSINK